MLEDNCVACSGTKKRKWFGIWWTCGVCLGTGNAHRRVIKFLPKREPTPADAFTDEQWAVIARCYIALAGERHPPRVR